jgi:hypothetical protein
MLNDLVMSEWADFYIVESFFYERWLCLTCYH